jgi:hypothetical protein
MRARIALIVIVIYLLLASSIDISQTWHYSDAGGFRSYAERISYMRLLRKHGLAERVSVVWLEGNEWVYYRELDGARCRLR